ncbi:MAG: hypothetical protein KC591_03675 [Gemmatimonadetes bacterium]|nr:hypothetical protein [Gemmatimonadota bacterium]
MRALALLVSVGVVFLSAFDALASELCIVPSPNGVNGSVACDSNPQVHDNAAEGYALSGYPCSSGMCLKGPDDYGWSISSSSTNSSLFSGPLSSNIDYLYLWLTCTTTEGIAAMECGLESDNTVFVPLAFEPMNGALNAGTATHLILAVGGCPREPFLIGRILVLYLGPVSVESESWGDIKAMYR